MSRDESQPKSISYVLSSYDGVMNPDPPPAISPEVASKDLDDAYRREGEELLKAMLVEMGEGEVVAEEVTPAKAYGSYSGEWVYRTPTENMGMELAIVPWEPPVGVGENTAAENYGSGLALVPWKPTAAEVVRRPEWLPTGWEVEVRVRKSGGSAGMRDKYYCNRDLRRRLRSKNEVLNFVETGTVKKRKHRSKTSISGSHQPKDFGGPMALGSPGTE